MDRIRWAEGAWALLVLFAAVLMACGLADAFTFMVEPPSYPTGHRLVLLGALGFAAAAVWAWLRPAPRWVTVLTVLPAVVIGGLVLQFEDGSWGVLAGLFLIPPRSARCWCRRCTRPASQGTRSRVARHTR